MKEQRLYYKYSDYLKEKYATIPTKTKNPKKNIIDNSCKVIIASPFYKK